MKNQLKYILRSPKGTYNTNYIKSNFPDHYEKIVQLRGIKFSEKLYQYLNPGITHNCGVCGKPTKFKNIDCGYYKYCSSTCAARSAERNTKIKSTNLSKYGVENISQLNTIKQKKKDTCVKHYGVEYPLQSAEIKNTYKHTCFEKYGVANVSQNNTIKQKKKDTCNERYGVDSHMKLPQYRYDIINSLTRKYGDNYMDTLIKISHNKTEEYLRKKHPGFIKYTNGGEWVMRCPHPDCTSCEEKMFVTPQKIYNDRIRYGSETCTKLLKIGEFTKNTSLEIFIKRILNEYNIEYRANVRNIIPPKELDIYIPSKNLAIECNGIYWHSVDMKPTSYHMEKYKACADRGIQLLTLWEDWITNKPQILESLLRSKLGCINDTVYARKCVIREINSKICRDFLDANHIQGTCDSSLRYGLYFNSDLVTVMCFSKRFKPSCSKYVVDDEYEMIRFCNKLNTRVVGGASKLLKHFISSQSPQCIISFSCNDISDGHLYEKLGFEKSGLNSSYWYIENTTLKRYHHSSFTKSNIIKRYPHIDQTLTETEMMSTLPYTKICDSGVTKWVLKI